MAKKRIMIVLLVAALGIFSIVVLTNPRPSIVCDDFQGGRLPPDTIRGIQCQCAGLKFYIKHDAPGDGQDLSICIGLMTETKTIK